MRSGLLCRPALSLPIPSALKLIFYRMDSRRFSHILIISWRWGFKRWAPRNCHWGSKKGGHIASLPQVPPMIPRILYALTLVLDTNNFLPRRPPAMPHTSTLMTPWSNHYPQLYAIIIAISYLWSLASYLSFISCKTFHLPHQFASS